MVVNSVPGNFFGEFTTLRPAKVELDKVATVLRNFISVMIFLLIQYFYSQSDFLHVVANVKIGFFQ